MPKSFVVAALACTLIAGCARHSEHALAGDWDVYVALSAQPKYGFEGWRRMGFAHFAGAEAGNVGFLKRRTGEPMLTVNHVAVNGDNVVLTEDPQVEMRATWHGDTLVGLQ